MKDHFPFLAAEHGHQSHALFRQNFQGLIDLLRILGAEPYAYPPLAQGGQVGKGPEEAVFGEGADEVALPIHHGQDEVVGKEGGRPLQRIVRGQDILGRGEDLFHREIRGRGGESFSGEKTPEPLGLIHHKKHR